MNRTNTFFKNQDISKLLFEELNVGIIVTDTDYKVEFINQIFEKSFDIGKKIIYEIGLKSIFSESVLKKIEQAGLNNSLKGTLTLNNLVNKISSKHVVFNSKVLYSSNEIIFLFFVNDSIEQLNEQLDKVGIGFLTISSDKKVINCNNAIKQYFGVFESKICWEYFNIDPANICHNTCIFFDISKFNKISEMELLTDTMIGKRYFKIITIPVVDNENNLLYVNKLFMDITSVKLMIDELRMKNRIIEENLNLKNEFISNVTHELKTPLTSILGYSELLSKKINNDNFEPVKFYNNSKKSLDLIHKSGKRLMVLIDNLLKLSEIENQNIKNNIERINLKYFFDQICLETHNISLNKNLTIKFEFDEKLNESEFYSDYEKIKIILMNLINNAVKFTEAGYIKISFLYLENQNKLSFRIEDTGIGINQKYHKIIFDPFRQIDGSMTRKYSGIGVGLSLVKKYTELLQGELILNSDEQKGTQVTVNFKID
ncbi:HAMP domain-containing histidine kinase [Candidatus Dependentiae bacterium]|nr:HAMP domain-containing histidine kinase [Candidatus Dependentiae bacterium]